MNKDNKLQRKLNKEQLKAIISRSQNWELIHSNPYSKNRKSYYRATGCSEKQDFRTGKRITKRCRSRSCNICESIKMSKMITAYLPSLAKKEKLFFLTLTAQTVEKEYLLNRLEEMNKIWRKMAKNNTENQFVKLNGLRKIEVEKTSKNKYHPHFHILMDSFDGAKWLIDQWLKHWQKKTGSKNVARNSAQKIIAVYSPKDTLIEMAKYVSKSSTGSKRKDRKGEWITINPKERDTILTALRGKRTIQPFGTFKKTIIDYDSEIDIKKLSRLKSDIYLWNNKIGNWISNSGELLGTAETERILKKHNGEERLNEFNKMIKEYNKLNQKIEKQNG